MERCHFKMVKQIARMGFPLILRRKFQDKLAPLLLLIYAEASENNILPPTLRQASITFVQGRLSYFNPRLLFKYNLYRT